MSATTTDVEVAKLWEAMGLTVVFRADCYGGVWRRSLFFTSREEFEQEAKAGRVEFKVAQDD